MATKKKKNANALYLEERIEYLEEVERFVVDALELAASLGDFQININKNRDITNILEETRAKVQVLFPFETTAFFLVDESSNEFIMRNSDSVNQGSSVQNEVDALIHDGTFAWALRERRPIIALTRDHQKFLLLHVMATVTRIRGMFVGVLRKDQHKITNASLSLLSIILLNSANAIEGYELYRRIREINTNLERIDNYRLLFEAAPDGVEVLDALGNIIDCNDTQKKLLGCNQEQLTGSRSSHHFSKSSRARSVNSASFLRENGYWEGEVELINAGGNIIPVWRKEKAIYDKDHQFIGAVVYNRDISAHKQAEGERQDLESRLKRAEKMEALGLLAGGVAHDLNNILSGLVSYPELLLLQLSKDHPLWKPVTTIKKSGERAAAIVDDLLTLARRGISRLEIVNLNDVILDYVKTPEHETLRQCHPNVRISLNLDGDIMNIKGSPLHLSKMVMNLLSNALEAIPDRGEVRIGTANRYLDRAIKGYNVIQEGNYVVLTVSDNGNGIAPEDLDKIFEPFFTKKVMGKSGTGLGLAVVWGTVKDHAGYIDVQSEDGKGSAFSIYFPITRESLTGDHEKVALEDYSGRGETILVVDDIIEQQEVAVSMLTMLGYKAHAVSSGEEALAYLKNNPVDLLVLDMIMEPGIDGLETYQRVLEVNPKQKAIIVSGFSETDRVERAHRLGAGAYVKKPYLLKTLGMAVRDELSRNDKRA